MKTPTPREILSKFRIKEWICTNDPTDTDEKIERRLDSALSSLREVVLGKKIDKKSVMHQLDIESHIRGYNKALEDIANLFGGGK